MITLHHLLVSQSERVIWLFEELGLPYALKTYPREETLAAPPAFLALHPLGSAPVIQDGEVTLAESLAIFTYVLDLHGDGRLRIAPGQPGYADFVYWFHYANAGLMPQLMFQLHAARVGDTEGRRADVRRERFARHLGMVDSRLAAHPHLAGESFTAADILLHFPFATMQAYVKVDLAGRPHIRAWLERLSQRPAYQRAMRIAGHVTDPGTGRALGSP